MEIAALTLLLGVLCYAFYDSNIKGSEQEVVLSNELLSHLGVVFKIGQITVVI